MTLRPALSLLLIWSIFSTVLPASGALAVAEQDGDATENSDGLRFRLSEGKEAVDSQPEASTANTIAAATTLSEAESNQLLSRLPPLKTDRDDSLNFKLRERSMPPPRAGETLQAAFAFTSNAGAPGCTRDKCSA